MAASGGSLDLEKLRVVDLKEKLSALSLPTTGNKADLVSRLRSYYEQKNAESAEANGSGDADMQVDSMDLQEGDEDSTSKERLADGQPPASGEATIGATGDSWSGIGTAAAVGQPPLDRLPDETSVSDSQSSSQPALHLQSLAAQPAATGGVFSQLPISTATMAAPPQIPEMTLQMQPPSVLPAAIQPLPAPPVQFQPPPPVQFQPPPAPPVQIQPPLAPPVQIQPPPAPLAPMQLTSLPPMQLPALPPMQLPALPTPPVLPAPPMQLHLPPAPPPGMAMAQQLPTPPVPLMAVPFSVNPMAPMQPSTTAAAVPLLPPNISGVQPLLPPPPPILMAGAMHSQASAAPSMPGLHVPPAPLPVFGLAPLQVPQPGLAPPPGLVPPPPPPPPSLALPTPPAAAPGLSAPLQSAPAAPGAPVQQQQLQPSPAAVAVPAAPEVAVDWASETASRLQVARQQQAVLDEQERQQQQVTEQQRLVEEELQLLEDELRRAKGVNLSHDEQAEDQRTKMEAFFEMLSQYRRSLLELEERHKRSMRAVDDEVLGKVVAEHDKKQAASATGPAPPGVRSADEQRAILFETQRRLVLEQQQLQSEYQLALEAQKRIYDDVVRQLHILQGRPDPGSAPGGVRLPSALEKALALKYMREKQHGRLEEQLPRGGGGGGSGRPKEDEAGAVTAAIAEASQPLVKAGLVASEVGGDDDDDEDEVGAIDMDDDEAAAVGNDSKGKPSSAAKAPKESKNKRKKKKKKKRSAASRNQQKQETADAAAADASVDDERGADGEPEDEAVEIEYVQEPPLVDRGNPLYYQFAKIFEAFKITDADKPKAAAGKEGATQEPSIGDKLMRMSELANRDIPMKARGLLIDEDLANEESKGNDDSDKPKLSKKKLKKLTRMTVAQLKQVAARPDVVEMQDVTAADPKLLVHLKATRNTVPVPRHWCMKRKYLQGKRGIEKAPFDLPDYIKATGIMEMRQSLADKEQEKSLKQKMREKVRPKMGKIDIDYQKLHDAFFRYQVKPRLTVHGDLYYEGKEFETRLKEKKPGNLSEDLRTALGMPVGETADRFPPPWLIAMQRYGPPPSYPNLKIPGLNAPLPDGCSFGYHAGGWGKPPVDETGRPLYGDVFGTQTTDTTAQSQDEEIDKSHWGELESESSEDEDESSDEDESEESGDEGGRAEEDTSGLVTPADAGLVTPSGLTSGVPAGMETPDMIELRKKRIEDAMEAGGETPALYTILPEKRVAVGAAMMGSAHIYDITAAKKAGPAAVAGGPGTTTTGTEGVEVALNPEELDLDTAAMQAKYDQTLREQRSQLEKEDLSDMVAEHAAKQSKKRKKQQQTEKATAAKKHKEFKF